MSEVVTMNKIEQKTYTLATDVIYGKLTTKEFSVMVIDFRGSNNELKIV